MISEALDIYFPKLAKIPELKAELILISKIFEFEAGTVILKQGSSREVISRLLKKIEYKGQIKLSQGVQ